MKYLKLFSITVVITILSLLSGALNWVNQTAIIILFYFLTGFLYNKNEFKLWIYFLILASPFTLIYGFFTFKDNLVYLYPIVFVPSISLLSSILLKVLFYSQKRIIYISLTGFFLVFSVFFAYIFMPNWILNFLVTKENIHNGGKISHLKFNDLQRNIIGDSALAGKITILEFWNSSCGICFEEFPEFEKFVHYYEADSNIAFYSVFIPFGEDTSRFIQNKKALSYNFNQLEIEFSEKDSILYKFNIKYFPSIAILDKDMNLYYSGTFQYRNTEIIDNGYKLVEKLRKRTK